MRKCQRKPKKEESKNSIDAENSDQHLKTPGSHTPATVPVQAENVPTLKHGPIRDYQVWKSWEYFLERVDPIVKILHRPSAATILNISLKIPSSLNESSRALIHSIYFSSVACMSDDEVHELFNMTKPTCLEIYRLSTEEALAKAVLLNIDEDLVALQALVLFLSVSHLIGEAKVAWKLSGLARRSTVFSHTSLSPLQDEMRNRLWWQLWYLDHRLVKDSGERDGLGNWTSFELPLNVNDSDLDPSSSCPIIPRMGWSEQTFALVRYKIAQAIQMLSGHITTSQKEDIIRNCERELNDLYLQYCTEKDSPIQWLTQHVAHVLIMEMWFELYSADTIVINSESLDDERQHGQGFRDHLFLNAIDIVDTTSRLETEPQSRQWAWLLRGYQQFCPLVFLLNELQYREQCAAVVHAWTVVDSALSRWPPTSQNSANRKIMMDLKKRANEIQLRLSERSRGN